MWRALAILLLIILAAVLAPLWTVHDPAGGSLSDTLSGPSGGHWLGTDDLGRDVFTRMVYGARLSLAAAVIAVGVALVIGLPFGLLAGYAGGRGDSAIMRVNDALEPDEVEEGWVLTCQSLPTSSTLTVEFEPL